MSCSEIVKNIKIIKIIIFKWKVKIRGILKNEFYASFHGIVSAKDSP